MTKALLWLALTYGAFKFAAILLARSPGFERSEIGLADRLRAGEPILFAVAFLLSVPSALLWDHYAHEAYSSVFRQSVGCYGRVAALKDVPEIRRRVDGVTVYDHVEGYQASAYGAGADLGLASEKVRDLLSREARKAAADYGELRRQGMRQEMEKQLGATLRCLQPPAEGPNA